jgi:hypothetical protein
MPERAEVVERIAALVGDDVLRVTDATSRWPALATLMVDGTEAPVSLFAARVGLTSRDRDEVERRFQNPGQDRPIVSIPAVVRCCSASGEPIRASRSTGRCWSRPTRSRGSTGPPDTRCS